MNSTIVSRRRAIQTLFCSSAALALNIRTNAQTVIGKDALHLLMIGDFGTGAADQQKVAAAMKTFAVEKKIRTEGLLMLGDNFYSLDKDGFSTESPRWKNWIEDMYPASVFPGPMWSILGNHDYHDNPGGEKVQMAYAKKPGVRWHMPAKWYRFEIGTKAKPLVTFLCLDTNLPGVSGGMDKKNKTTRPSLTAEEEQEQLAWLKSELAKPRAPFTIVAGHHPLYSNGAHGDTKALLAQWEPLFQEHKVHAYLCGHDHDLQHLELEGHFTSFVLSGGGGASLRKLSTERKMPFGQEIHGFTHLQIAADTLTFTHHAADGAVLHTFSKKLDGSFVVG